MSGSPIPRFGVPPVDAPRPRTARRRTLAALAAAAAAIALLPGAAHAAVSSPGTIPATQEARTAAPGAPRPLSGTLAGSTAKSRLAPARSGLPWLSGVWLGGGTTTQDTAGATAWGAWRGAPVDAVTTYAQMTLGWDGMRRSEWSVRTFAGFPGVLLYGLPMMPTTEGSFAEVISGARDDVFTQIGRDLATHPGGAIVRIGWEAQGEWMPWHTTAATAPSYRAAFRRIATLVKAQAPQALIDFDINCVTPLKGQRDRLDSLTLLYPGDDVVDIVGCDHYDWWAQRATGETAWAAAIRPPTSPGLADVAEFARAHGNGMSIPEWGLASTARMGLGDNAFYIRAMRRFMADNADILVVENYWDDPRDVGGGLMSGQNPASAAAYRASLR